MLSLLPVIGPAPPAEILVANPLWLPDIQSPFGIIVNCLLGLGIFH